MFISKTIACTMLLLLQRAFSHGRNHHYRYPYTVSPISINSISMNSITYARDRALDQTVEKENYLRAVINLKNLIKSEPSKSLPLSAISDQRHPLSISIRPIDFIRRHPFVFEEFSPTRTSTHPHVRLTPDLLDLDAEEQQICQRESFLNESADKLLKLLMLSRVNRLPVTAVDRITWDLGIPRDYLEVLVPKFPDYFRVNRDTCGDFLELVCWSKELSVSVMEKKSMKDGMPPVFPLQNSRGFGCDKKYGEWVDHWQRLPYFTPYENAPDFPSSSDECDKWASGVLHELLHVLCSKKMEKEELLVFGKHLGLRWKFNRALMYHPGIFYLSCRNRTETVVLREGFKRDVLIEKHPLMEMRSRYTHLMNRVKQGPKKGRHNRSGEKEMEEKASGGSGLCNSSVEEARNDDEESGGLEEAGNRDSRGRAVVNGYVGGRKGKKGVSRGDEYSKRSTRMHKGREKSSLHRGRTEVVVRKKDCNKKGCKPNTVKPNAEQRKMIRV